MARFLLIALLSATALLAIQARQLSRAGPSTAEVFWHTVLPDSPLPDSILWLLHPDDESESNGEIVNIGTASVDDSDDGSLSQPDYPFFYFGYKGSSPTPAGDDDDDIAESLSQPDYPFFYIGYKRSSPTPASDKNAEMLSQDYPFFYFGYKHSSPTPADGGQVATSHNEAAATGTVVFFREEAVRVGEVLPVHFPPARRSPRGLLPRNVADSVPFATSALPDILARFDIASGSVQAAKTERTLGMCETPSLEGEAKFCATSLEALVEGAVAELGTRDIRPVTSTLPRFGAPLQPYTIRAVRPVEGSSFVACHNARYPFTVFMCHDTGKVRAYMADMEDARGSAVTVAIVCHTDTSKWDPEHMSFKLLGTKPGGSPVCHFMPYGHIMWAKNPAPSSA